MLPRQINMPWYVLFGCLWSPLAANQTGDHARATTNKSATWNSSKTNRGPGPRHGAGKSDASRCTPRALPVTVGASTTTTQNNGPGGGVNAWRYGLPDITPQRSAGAAPGAPRRPDINARWRERDERWGTTLLSARTPTSNRQIQPRFFLEPACPHGLGKHSAQPGHTQTTDPSACGREGVANGCAPRRRAHIHMSCSQAKSQTSGRRGFGCWVCRPTVGHTNGGACTHCNWLTKKKVHATVVPQTRP